MPLKTLGSWISLVLLVEIEKKISDYQVFW